MSSRQRDNNDTGLYNKTSQRGDHSTELRSLANTIYLSQILMLRHLLV